MRVVIQLLGRTIRSTGDWGWHAVLFLRFSSWCCMRMYYQIFWFSIKSRNQGLKLISLDVWCCNSFLKIVNTLWTKQHTSVTQWWCQGWYGELVGLSQSPSLPPSFRGWLGAFSGLYKMLGEQSFGNSPSVDQIAVFKPFLETCWV
jgi:hypothetical protein